MHLGGFSLSHTHLYDIQGCSHIFFLGGSGKYFDLGIENFLS
jgi:hypothetical protein